jgi:hypothetical protein
MGLAGALLLGAAPTTRPTPPKARRVLAPTGFPGWQTHNVTFPVVVRDSVPGRWRLFYTGSATEQISESAWDLWVTGVVTSSDLVHWTYPDDYEPVLIGTRFLEGDLVDLTGAPRRFDAIVAAATSVLRVGRQWHAWYTGWNGDERPLGAGRVEQVHQRIGHATSPDGLRWSKEERATDDGAVIGLGDSSAIDALGAAHPSVLKTDLGYQLWYEAYDGRAFRIAQAHSADGRSWTKTGVVLEGGAAAALDGLGVGRPVVRKAGGILEMWYQGRSASAPQFHVLRARSSDGRNWTKVDGEVALHPDAPVSGDERIHVGSVIERPDGSLMVFFAKETADSRPGAWGPVVDRTTAIYSEIVRP